MSLITQGLYSLVFCSRYLDLFWIDERTPWWNIIVKNFYIWTSIYVIVVMMRVYPRTREREKGWKLGAFSLGGSIILAPIAAAIFDRKHFDVSHVSLWHPALFLP